MVFSIIGVAEDRLFLGRFGATVHGQRLELLLQPGAGDRVVHLQSSTLPSAKNRTLPE